jgi:maltose-binding protein MalE
MKTWRTWVAALPVAALALTACGGDSATPEPSDTEPSATESMTAEPTETASASEAPVPPARADADLVIWADDTRTPIITPFAEQFAQEQGITVAVQEVAIERMRDFVTTAGPAGEGPDVFIGAHDWLGELATNGVVAPLDIPNPDDYLPVAVSAFNWEGQTYGLPYAIENIALVRNTALAPERPATLDELASSAAALVESGDAEIAIGWQQPDVYHNYWVVTGAGGYVFGTNDDGSYNPDDLGVDSEGGLAAAGIFGDLVEQGVVSQDVSYDIMIEAFTQGTTPYAITGPWAISAFEEGDVEFVVEPLPTVAGGEARPFVGVQGFYVSAFSENELAAKTFVIDFMGTDEAQLALYEVGNRPPALQSAFDAAASDPVVAGFGEAGANGYAMPSIPEMGSVWDAWGNGYTLILQGEDPQTSFQEAADQIRTLIGS